MGRARADSELVRPNGASLPFSVFESFSDVGTSLRSDMAVFSGASTGDAKARATA